MLVHSHSATYLGLRQYFCNKCILFWDFWFIFSIHLGHNTELAVPKPKMVYGEFRFYFLMRLDLDWMWSLSKCFTCPFLSAIFFDTPYTSAQSTVILVLVNWMKRQSALCELFKHTCEEISISLFRICNWGRGLGVVCSFFLSSCQIFCFSDNKIYMPCKSMCVINGGWLQCLD